MQYVCTILWPQHPASTYWTKYEANSPEEACALYITDDATRSNTGAWVAQTIGGTVIVSEVVDHNVSVLPYCQRIFKVAPGPAQPKAPKAHIVSEDNAPLY